MSISSINSGLQSYLQGLSSTTSAANLGAVTAAATTSTPSGAASTTATTSGTTGTHFHHRARSGLKAIQNAVTQALQQAQSAGTTADPNKIVEDAIAKIFKNGITSPDQTSANDALTGQAVDDPSAANSDFPDASTSTFLETLQSFGVSPNQFQSDFTAAVKDAQNGSTNLATAMQSFPNGSALDVWG
jgi:hypothetical protein